MFDGTRSIGPRTLRLTTAILVVGLGFLATAGTSGANTAAKHCVPRPKADLEGCDFAHANLEDANLKDANLTDANLSDANLHDAKLTGANFTGTNLKGTKFKGADLDFVAFWGDYRHSGIAADGLDVR